MTRAESHKIEPLEGLRAIAVGLVLFGHTTPWHVTGLDLFQWWDPGAAGVRLFFVLSGFLITGILLRARETGGDRWRIMGAFYVRRALRILPLAYFALIVAALIDIPGAREQWPWYAGYAVNVRMAITGAREPALSHLWSLAVEEQFYLIWPWLLLWIARSALGRSLAAMIALALVTRFALLASGHPLAAYVLMPARLDGLAAGSLLAVWVHARRQLPRWLWAPGILTVAIGAWLPAGPWANSAMEAGMVVVSLLIVDWARQLSRGPAWRIARHPVLVYLGGISYGIYVWHPMARLLWQSANAHLGIPIYFPPNQGVKLLMYVSAATIVIASLTWFGFEKRLNDLKRWFPYVKRA